MEQASTQSLVDKAMKRFGGATKKPAKKPGTKKPAKKPGTKKPAAKKPAAKKVAAKKPAAKKVVAKKPATKSRATQHPAVKAAKRSLHSTQNDKSHMTSWRIPKPLQAKLLKFCNKQSQKPAHTSVFNKALDAWIDKEMQRKGDTPGLEPARKTKGE